MEIIDADVTNWNVPRQKNVGAYQGQNLYNCSKTGTDVWCSMLAGSGCRGRWGIAMWTVSEKITSVVDQSDACLGKQQKVWYGHVMRGSRVFHVGVSDQQRAPEHGSLGWQSLTSKVSNNAGGFRRRHVKRATKSYFF